MAQNIERIESESGSGTIVSLRAQLEQLETIQAERQNTVALVAEQAAERNWASSSELLASQALQALERQRAELSARIAEVGPDASATVDLREQLQQIEVQLEDTTQAELAALRANVASTQQQTDTLRQQIRSTVLDSNLSSQVLTEFYGLQQRAQLARSQYQTLLSRSQDLQAQASLQLPDSRIVSPALPPSRPSSPNTRLNLILGAIAGLAIGIGVAFLYENYVGGFTSEQQAEAVLRHKVASIVPKLRRSSPDVDAPADQMANSPLSIFAESVRRIRVGFDQALTARPARGKGLVMMVTSSLPGEGKSTLALSLARSYAAAGKATLLIDGDLRKPSLHRLVNLQPKHGLLDFLRSDANSIKDELVHHDPLSGAVMLLGARRSEVPADQIVSDKGFAGLIEQARKTFDVVVVDTSPLIPVVDGLYIARLVDAAVFVVRWGSTRQQDAKAGIGSLEAALGAKPLMLVMSQQEISSTNYQQRYGSYYTEAVT
jgi:capsular exopolysaccharide synthesis family protein